MFQKGRDKTPSPGETTTYWVVATFPVRSGQVEAWKIVISREETKANRREWCPARAKKRLSYPG